jgi:hypothetical protein
MMMNDDDVLCGVGQAMTDRRRQTITEFIRPASENTFYDSHHILIPVLHHFVNGSETARHKIT